MERDLELLLAGVTINKSSDTTLQDLLIVFFTDSG